MWFRILVHLFSEKKHLKKKQLALSHFPLPGSVSDNLANFFRPGGILHGIEAGQWIDGSCQPTTTTTTTTTTTKTTTKQPPQPCWNDKHYIFQHQIVLCAPKVAVS